MSVSLQDTPPPGTGQDPVDTDRKETLRLLRDSPFSLTATGMIVPEPSYHKLAFEFPCLRCVRAKAVWMARGWTRSRKQIFATLCDACKEALEAVHRTRKSEFAKEKRERSNGQ